MKHMDFMPALIHNFLKITLHTICICERIVPVVPHAVRHGAIPLPIKEEDKVLVVGLFLCTCRVLIKNRAYVNTTAYFMTCCKFSPI